MKSVIYLLAITAILIGCSSNPIIVEEPYPVYYPGVHDTVYLEQDTVYSVLDSNAYWSGDVEDSLMNVIGWLKVYYNRKIAELKLNSRTDTVMVTDTLQAQPIRIVETVYGLLPEWGQIALMLIASLLLYFTARKQITNPIWEMIKKLWSK